MSGETSVVRSAAASLSTILKSLAPTMPLTRTSQACPAASRCSSPMRSTCTVSTRAAAGCWVERVSTNESSVSWGPLASMCTPSEELRTQPESPRAVAVRHTKGR